MKTWRHVIIDIIGAITIAFAFIACAIGNKHNSNKVFTLAIIEEVYLQGGTFVMGNDLGTAAIGDITPVNTVILTGLYMGKYEVTQGQYQTVMSSLPSNLDSETNTYGKGNNHPVYIIR
jgi:formylglycine-generating enzyme required for sulfatase activity